MGSKNITKRKPGLKLASVVVDSTQVIEKHKADGAMLERLAKVSKAELRLQLGKALEQATAENKTLFAEHREMYQVLYKELHAAILKVAESRPEVVKVMEAVSALVLAKVPLCGVISGVRIQGAITGSKGNDRVSYAVDSPLSVLVEVPQHRLKKEGEYNADPVTGKALETTDGWESLYIYTDEQVKKARELEAVDERLSKSKAEVERLKSNLGNIDRVVEQLEGQAARTQLEETGEAGQQLLAMMDMAVNQTVKGGDFSHLLGNG